jgi:hypothetical protein
MLSKLVNKEKRHSNKEMEHFREYMKHNPPKNFTSKNISVSDFTNSVKRGKYDLNPLHQREVVHGDSWQSKIVESVLLGKPLGSPEFDTVQNEIGLSIFRSLDGKQRLSAIDRFINNKYKFKVDIKHLKNKKFEEWPEIWRDHLLGCEFNICTTTATLSDNEVTEYFNIKQNTKKTTSGEKLNSVLSVRTNLCRDICKLVKYGTKKEGTACIDNRKNCFEIVVRSCYAIDLFNNTTCKDGFINLNYDPKINKHIDFLNKSDVNDITTFKYYQNIIKEVFEFIDIIHYNNKWGKTFVLPLLVLNIINGKFDKIKSFVLSRISGKDNFYPQVNGRHSATKERIIIIDEKFKSYISV